MQIAVISTSPRKGSNTLNISRFLAQKFRDHGHHVTVLDMEDCDIPMLGRGSMNPEALTAYQTQFIAGWAAADLVIFGLPEYNWTNGGEFLNALHQLGTKSFSYLFNKKVFSCFGVSAGRGGRLPALDATVVLNKLISFTGSVAMVSPMVFEAHESHKNVNAAGQSTGNTVFDQALLAYTDYTLKIAQIWKDGLLASQNA
jgi:chromate reductase, NAD(P)H dehydrogenase (quinone)